MPDVKFLVVEDSPAMRQLIAFALKRIQGAKIVEVSDGIEALKKIAAETFNLIITDITMPIMDGLKLVSLIRENDQHKETPIIIITGDLSEEQRKIALAVGANAYLTKPIQPAELLKLVNQLIKK
jgi:two-component system, chemotaxis family, chemotaxis protein CheY